MTVFSISEKMFLKIKKLMRALRKLNICPLGYTLTGSIYIYIYIYIYIRIGDVWRPTRLMHLVDPFWELLSEQSNGDDRRGHRVIGLVARYKAV